MKRVKKELAGNNYFQNELIKNILWGEWLIR